MKYNILRRFAEHGVDVRVYPATTPASELLKDGPDGVFFSNHLFVLAPDEVGHLPTHPDAANTNFLHFSRIRSCDEVELQRALSPAGPWTTIARFNPRTATSTVRPDAGLVAGTTYSYRMRTIQTATGATSRWSDIAKGTPRTAEEVGRPAARLRINHDNPRTDQLKLHVSITTHPDVVQYRLSHKPLTATDPWQAWAAGKALAYTLPGLTGAGTVRLYAEVRDGDGFVSETFGDTITFDPSTAANPDNDGDGISDSDEILVHGTDPDRADTDGDASTTRSSWRPGSSRASRIAMATSSPTAPRQAPGPIRNPPTPMATVRTTGRKKSCWSPTRATRAAALTHSAPPRWRTAR